MTSITRRSLGQPPTRSREGGDLTSQGEARARATILGSSLSGYSFDPLTGVLDAMGNNSSAALAYLAPTTENGAVDTSRVADLSARTWDEAGLAGCTGAVAAASSLRTSEVGNQSEQATQLAGSAIHSLARSTSADAYNEDAKARTGMLLANCPAELVVAAQMPNDQGAAVKDPETGSPFPEATSDDMRTLIYDVADSTSAVTTMSSTVADYTHNHAVALAKDAEGDEQTKISALNNEYNHGAQAAGLIAGLADSRGHHQRGYGEERRCGEHRVHRPGGLLHGGQHGPVHRIPRGHTGLGGLERVLDREHAGRGGRAHPRCELSGQSGLGGPEIGTVGVPDPGHRQPRAPERHGLQPGQGHLRLAGQRRAHDRPDRHRPRHGPQRDGGLDQHDQLLHAVGQ